MRVLQVTNTYPPADVSGVGTLVAELARALSAAGHEASVLTRRAAAGDPGVQATGGPKLLFPLAAAVRGLALLSGGGFDLVHVHESDGALLLAGLRLCRAVGLRAGRTRAVATLQVSYRRERLAVRPVSDPAGRVLSRPTAGERIFAWLRAPVLSLLGRVTARLSDAVLAPSRQTARELAEDYGARVAAVIPNGVAPAPPHPPLGAGPVVLFAGRLRTRKAAAVLLEAWPEVLAAVPHAELRLAGDGEQRAALAARAEALGIAGSVRFLGAVSRADVARELDAARVFCLPSTYEGVPLAILEAMAHGVAVVATSVAGVPEAVEDGRTGLLVPPADPPALARALARLLLDPERAAGMGAAGRERLERELSASGIARAHLELYGRLAGA